MMPFRVILDLMLSIMFVGGTGHFSYYVHSIIVVYYIYTLLLWNLKSNDTLTKIYKSNVRKHYLSF